MKTVLIIISKEVIRRNVLTEVFWRELFAQKNVRIVLVVEPGKEDQYALYASERVTIVGTKKEPVSLFHRLVLFLVRSGIDTHGVKLYRWRSYTMGEAALTLTLVKALIAATVARAGWYHALIRFFFARLSLSWIEELLDTHAPDLVFAPSLINVNVDALIAAAARRRGIRVVGMMRSWDNLVLHGLLAFVPDRFVLQNRWLARCAERFHSVDLARLTHDSIGLPHYDKYRNPEALLRGRTAFFRSMGLDPARRLIFFGGFDFYWSEDTVLRRLDEAVENGRIENAQIVFRPHPRPPYPLDTYHLHTLKRTILNDAFSGPHAFSDAETFINLVHHSDVLVISASTLAIDGAVFDRPIVCMGFDDPSKRVPYWKQAMRLFDTFDHFERLIDTGGVRLSRSFDELVANVNAYLENSAQDAPGRARIIEEFVAPFDGRASARLARILDEELVAISPTR